MTNPYCLQAESPAKADGLHRKAVPPTANQSFRQPAGAYAAGAKTEQQQQQQQQRAVVATPVGLLSSHNND
jgi:hypothetical protein